MALNIRQQKYKKNRLLGMNCYNAALSAGYSVAVAKSHTKELEERVKIADILDRQGLTDKALAAKHKELLEAYRLIVIDGKPLAVEEGGVKIPELFIQIKALELAYKLKDFLKDGHQINVDNSKHIHKTFVYLDQKAIEENAGNNNRVAVELPAKQI